MANNSTTAASTTDIAINPVEVKQFYIHVSILNERSLGTNSTRFHVEITIINFIYYYYLTIGVWGLGFGDT